MTIRVNGAGTITFDLEPEALSSTRNWLRERLIEHFQSYIDDQLERAGGLEQFREEMLRQARNEIETRQFAARVAQHVNHGYLVQELRTTLVNDLLNDERFRTRMMRVISEATVGLADETTERVIARMEERSGSTTADA
jgi:hypothetical protein